MSANNKISWITFIFGDVFVMIWTTINGILTDITHFGIQVISTIVIGVAGGLAGMVAKDIYPRIKKVFKK